MGKKCENQHASIRARIHTPKTQLHPHLDRTIEVKGQTDFEAWAKACRDILGAFGYTDARLQIGFFWDLINQLPPQIRQDIVTGVVNGWSLKITEEENDEGEPILQVGATERYAPLHQGSPDVAVPNTGERRTKSGLYLP